MLIVAALVWSAAVVFCAVGIGRHAEHYISKRLAAAVHSLALSAAVFMSLHALALAVAPSVISGRGLGLHDGLALAERFVIAPALAMGNLGLSTMIGLNYVRVRSGRRRGATMIALAALAALAIVAAMIFGVGQPVPTPAQVPVFVESQNWMCRMKESAKELSAN
jgi:hypothetical protein